MAAKKQASGVKLFIRVGDGAEPEVFKKYCSLTTQNGVQFQGEENTFTIEDCEDPEALAWITSEMVSKRMLFSGAGTVHTPDVEDFDDWWQSGDTVNCQVVLEVPAIDGGVMWEGGFKLPNWSITGTRGEKVNVETSFASDGAVTRVPNPAPVGP